MARVKRETVEYFPHFVSSGKTIFILEQTYGNDGYAFWFKLLEILGSSDGHFIDCNNVTTWRFLQAKMHLSEDTTCSLLDLLSELDAIDQNLWKNRIIWSDNFVKNLTPVYSNRRSEIPKKPIITSRNNSTGELLHVEIEQKPITTQKKRQSKVKESKVKESKVDICIYGSQKNVKLTDEEYQRLLNEYPETDEAIEYLSLYMIEKGDKSKAKTHNATLRRWVIDAVREKNQKREVRQKKVNTGNFKQRQYSEEQLNALIQ